MFDLLTLLLLLLGAGGAYFLVLFVIDIVKNKNNLGKENPILAFIIGFITDFLDTLGIGSFAPTTMLMQVTKFLKNDKQIPGTLNVSHTIPVLAEAFIFLQAVEVEGITLFSLVISAIVGALVGARVVNKLPEKKIQIVMGICLLVTAGLMFAGKMDWIAGLGVGTAIGLTGWKLAVGIIGNFILGGLMMAGVGLYAPCMAMVYMLGLNPKVAFPIMMASCAGLMAIGSPEFIKAGNYTRIGSIGIAIGGIVGVFVAAKIVTGLDVQKLIWGVIVVVVITAISMLKKGLTKTTV